METVNGRWAAGVVIQMGQCNRMTAAARNSDREAALSWGGGKRVAIKTDMALLVVRRICNDGVVGAAGESGRLNEVPVRQGLLSQAELAWSTPEARSCFLGSNNFPSLCPRSDLCFHFPIPSQTLPSALSACRLSHAACTYSSCLYLNRLPKSTHIHNRHYGESLPMTCLREETAD